MAAQLSPPKQGVIQRTGTAGRQKTAAASHEKQQSDNGRVRAAALTQNQQEESQSLASQKNASKQDIEVQRKLVKYTRALVWVGLLQGIVLFLTVLVIQRQTNFFRNSERAWIVCAPDNWSPSLAVMPPAGQVPLNVFEVWVKNLGKTPARVIGMASKYVKLERMEDLPSEPDYKDAYSLSGLLLVPNERVGQRLPLKPSSTLSQEEERKINNAQMFLYAFGLVVYEDAFGKQRCTRWGYLYEFPQGGLVSFFRPSFQRGGPARYNEST